MTAGIALEMWSRQDASNESQDGKTVTVSFTRAFTITIAAGDRIEEAYNAPGLPLLGDLYPGTTFVFCKRPALQRVSPIMVIATCSYSGQVDFSGDPASSPVGGDPVLEWGCSITDEAIDEDWNGKPIVTKNNEPIQGLTERLADDVLTVERNFLTVNRYALRAYRRATNSDTFYGWPPGTCRIMDDNARAVLKPDGSVAFWRVRAVFQFREPFNTTAAKAWYKRVRHEGFYVRDSAGADPHHAWDKKTKQPVTRPVLLKADGTLETNSDNAVWLQFQTLGSLPFSALGLS
jgi:hypothetical protein